MHNRSTKD